MPRGINQGHRHSVVAKHGSWHNDLDPLRDNKFRVPPVVDLLDQLTGATIMMPWVAIHNG
ncbi:MAG: hypothetical protein QOD09_4311 [Bradyrhizobium sp.]|jgi:hypothetical protein|nr:hypothetical protein [Bradyrhizobium sp.]